MPAQIDAELINRVVTSFPENGDWKICLASSFLDGKRIGLRSWQSISHLRGVGGIYAFLFPARHFAQPRTIHLHGPKGGTIPFCFSARPLQNGLNVVYIGRSSNLRNRLVGHHSIGNRQASAPVKYGLIDCGLCRDQGEAIAFIHNEATIAWHELPGEDNVANRDMLEHSLILRHFSPFNVKAEH